MMPDIWAMRPNDGLRLDQVPLLLKILLRCDDDKSSSRVRSTREKHCRIRDTHHFERA